MSLTAQELIEMARSLQSLDMTKENNGSLYLTSTGLEYVTDDEYVRGWFRPGTNLG